MNELTPEQREKMAEFFDQHVHTIPHLMKKLEEDFAKTPEGAEVKFLKDVNEHYITKIGNFLRYFISSEEGKIRGVDELINGLEHPSSQIPKDEKLHKELKGLAEDIKKRKLPDWRQINHYEKLRDDILQVKESRSTAEFLATFNELLIRAVAKEYEHSSVAEAIRKRSPKLTPAIINIEDHDLVVDIWKLMLVHLFRPDQKDGALKVIGKTDFTKVYEKIAIRLKISPEAVKAEVTKCFAADYEDNNMSNLIRFATAMVEEGNKNIFARALIATAREDQAKKLVHSFGSKGKVKSDPKTAQNIVLRINGLSNENAIISLETAAKAELHKLIAVMLDADKKEISVERDKFAHAIDSRIKAIEEGHAKSLAEVTEMHKQEVKREHELFSAGVVLRDTGNEIQAIGNSIQEHYARASEILAILYAHASLKQLAAGTISEQQFMADAEKKRAEVPTELVFKQIERIKNIGIALKTMTPDQSVAEIKKIDEYVKQLGQQIPLICEKVPKFMQKIEDISFRHEETQRAFDDRLSTADREATEYDRKMRRSGLYDDYEEEARSSYP